MIKFISRIWVWVEFYAGWSWRSKLFWFKKHCNQHEGPNLICIKTNTSKIWLNKNIYLCHQHDYLLLTAVGKQDLYQSNCHQTDTQSNKLVSPHVFHLEGTCCLNWLYGILASIVLGWCTYLQIHWNQNKKWVNFEECLKGNFQWFTNIPSI